MAKRTEYELKIAIGGKVDNSLSKSVKDINSKLDSIGSTAKAVVGAATTAFASIQLKNLFDDTTEAAKEMQTSMAGVAKVVDGLKDENGKVTRSYYEMKESILDLSENLPKTAEDIAAIMEAAGQSNIAKDELLQFAEDATKMGVAFDTTAEQAGEWMAAWRTALNLDQEGVVTLADQINYLGNTTTEDALKISEVVTRIGQLANTAGISAASVAALSASMTKVAPEVAATGIKNFALALVAGDSATKKQTKTFKTLGLEASKVAKAMQVDSQGTIIDVLERINKLDKDKQTSVMKNLFGSESLASIAPLVANLDNVKAQFEKVGDSALYAGSMEQEYLSASSTVANIDILKDNKIKAMQIKIGDILLPLSATISETTGNMAQMFGDFVEDNAPILNVAIRGIQDTFQENLPNIVYGLKSLAEGGKNFLNGFRPVIDLIEDNPSLVPNFLKSTGAAIVSYKIGKNLTEIAKGARAAGSPLKLLSGIITNPWALAIGAVAGGIALIATNIASAEKELRAADLASRFGNITLSLEDLDQLASQMLYTDNLGKLSESMKIRDGLDGLKNSINDAITEMNKLNWKVGIGLELTEEEKAAYQNSVTTFIADTQQLLDDNYYALSLSLEVFTSDDETGQGIRENAKQYYLEVQNELMKLGEQLFSAVQEGFSDGVLTLDEVKTISSLQSQMAAITDELAQSKFKANLEVMKTKLGTDLTPESYSNFIAEIQEQQKEIIADYDESLALNIAYSNVRLKKGDISKEEHDKEVAHYKKNYLEAVSESNLTISQFATDTLIELYGKEMVSALSVLDEKINSIPGKYEDDITSYLNEGDYGSVSFQFEKMYHEIKGLGVLSKEEQQNLKNKYLEIIPTKEELEKRAQEYIDANKKVPEAIQEELNTIYMIGALGGDEESVYSLLGAKIGTNEEYRDLIEKVDSIGIDLVPDALLNSMDSKMPDIKAKVNEIKATITNGLSSGVRADVPVNITLQTTGSIPNIANIKFDKINSDFLNNLGGHKDGGIFNTPHIAWFAEDGPEAAIPLDGSPEAIQLWQMAGQILGMFENKEYQNRSYSIPNAYQQLVQNTSSSNHITNSPSINIEYNIKVENGADSEKVQKAITMSQAQFNYMMSQWEKNRARTNMSGGGR